MDAATLTSRIQFAFTIAFHYLFPPLSMGLALLIFVLKTIALRTNGEAYRQAARFWIKIFALTFIMGVVTGIPMEFQFGTNWALFSSYAGNVIAQLLAMEGAFAFFLESAFVGLLLFGEERFGQRVHWLAALLVWLGTWASGFFITAANAWLQNPVGFTKTAAGGIAISDYWAILTNPWLGAQYLHVMLGATITGAFAMAGLGAYYLLLGTAQEYGRIFVRLGVIVGVVASVLQLFPSGDLVGGQVARVQPVKLAAMEGQFTTERGAGLAIIGQPDVEARRLDNPIVIPNALSFLTYRRWSAEVRGLDAFPQDQWPDAIPLLYFSYRIMVGLGTFFIAIMGIAAGLLRRGRLWKARWALWLLMLAIPFPFIANIGGWFTAELGRQPWLIYNLLRTRDGGSPTLSSGNILFTLIGFAGVYAVLALLYVVLMVQEIAHGPAAAPRPPEPDSLPASVLAD